MSYWPIQPRAPPQLLPSTLHPSLLSSITHSQHSPVTPSTYTLLPHSRSLVAFVHGHTSPRPLTMLLLDRGHVATALGYASIGCWLCAQLPFVLSWRAPSSSTQRYLPLATRVHCSFHYCLQHYGCANTRRQVIKNYQLASCDGLSFPFLVTWLFGMSPRVAIAALFKALTSYRRLHQPHRLHPH